MVNFAGLGRSFPATPTLGLQANTLAPEPGYMTAYMREQAETGRFTASEQRQAAEFTARMRQTEQLALQQYQSAAEVARIYSSSNTAQARATVQRAQIDAKTALEVARIAAAAQRADTAAKIQIAKMQTELDRQRFAAVELARPGDWVARVGFFRGQTPEQAAALTKYGGGTVFGGQVPPGTTAPGPTPAPQLPTLPGYQALVGERGPEVLTTTPTGANVRPLPSGRRPRLPGLQAGGTLGYPPPDTATVQRPQLTWAQQAAMGPRQRERLAARRTRETRQPGATPTPAASPVNELPFLRAARAGGQFNVAPFQGWTGPTTIPSVGVTTPVPAPWQYNIVQFRNMSVPEQSMLAATWRALNMISGESEAEVLANAYEAIGRSAWTGAALPQVSYGGW